MDYLLVPATDEIKEAINKCNEDACDEECTCYMKDDCINNYHRLSEITDKMQNAINEYARCANVKIGEFYPNLDRMQTMQYAKGIIREVLETQ